MVVLCGGHHFFCHRIHGPRPYLTHSFFQRCHGLDNLQFFLFSNRCSIPFHKYSRCFFCGHTQNCKLDSLSSFSVSRYSEFLGKTKQRFKHIEIINETSINKIPNNVTPLQTQDVFQLTKPILRKNQLKKLVKMFVEILGFL